MLVSIHQPQFMPWLGYFDKIDRADAFVFLDTVQYKKNEWQNRNRIKTAQGPQWLTVPVRYHFPERIEEVLVNPDVNWAHKHLQSLVTNYARAPHWAAAQEALQELYGRSYGTLAEVNAATIEWLRRCLDIDTPCHWASQLDIDTQDPTQRLIDICRRLGGTAYLSGVDGRNYLEVDRFSAAGIEVMFQAFHHPEYRQLFGAFESHLSALDLVLNCGPDSGAILRGQHGDGGTSGDANLREGD